MWLLSKKWKKTRLKGSIYVCRLQLRMVEGESEDRQGKNVVQCEVTDEELDLRFDFPP